MLPSPPRHPERLAFVGTPAIAVPPLRALVESGRRVELVVSRPDTRRHRRGHDEPSPVKAAALELGLPVTDDIDEIVWQAVELKDGSLVQQGSASFAAGVSQATAALSPGIDLAASVGFASTEATGGLGLGISPYVSDDVMGVASATVALAKTQVTLDRTSTVDSADVGWFVVTFRRRRVQVLE